MNTEAQTVNGGPDVFPWNVIQGGGGDIFPWSQLRGRLARVVQGDTVTKDFQAGRVTFHYQEDGSVAISIEGEEPYQVVKITGLDVRVVKYGEVHDMMVKPGRITFYLGEDSLITDVTYEPRITE